LDLDHTVGEHLVSDEKKLKATFFPGQKDILRHTLCSNRLHV
jgi:hypothetical protein